MSRDEQLELNRFITQLLKSKYKETFWTKLQGGDTAKTLVIASNNKRVIGRIHNYLINDLNLIVIDGTKKHGRGGNFTRLINLSEIDTETVKGIRHRFDLLLKKQLRKERMILSEKSSKKVVPIIPAEPVVETIPDVVKIEKDYELKSFTTSISWMLKFEGVAARSFSCDKIEPGKYCVYCKNSDIVAKVLPYLVWLAGDSSLVESDKDIVIIDYVSRKKKGEEFEKNLFCLPPSDKANSEEIKKRLIKINHGSRPIISDLGESKFLVKYVRSNFAEKIFPVLLSMGWKVENLSKNSFIVSVVSSVSSVPEVQTLPDSNKEVHIAVTDRDKFDLSIPQNQSNLLFGVETKEEAFKELEKLYKDSVLFNGLSPETQQRIIAVLKEEFRKRNPEEYAKNLLSIIGK